ncbi:MAG: hypothetical protein RL622_870, partial [Actinomycetota bacterium]
SKILNQTIPDAVVINYINTLKSVITKSTINNQVSVTALPSIPGEFQPDTKLALLIISTALKEKRDWLSELEAKSVLKAYHIPVVFTKYVATPEEAAEAPKAE